MCMNFKDPHSNNEGNAKSYPEKPSSNNNKARHSRHKKTHKWLDEISPGNRRP